MQYRFELLGVANILTFFNHQQQRSPHSRDQGVEYVGTRRCTLDAVIHSIEPIPPKRGWDLDAVIDTVIQYWLNNSETVERWRERLEDAGQESVLVAKVGDLKAIRAEFESLLGESL